MSSSTSMAPPLMPAARTDAGHHAYGPARTEALLAAAMAHTHASAGCIVDASPCPAAAGGAIEPGDQQQAVVRVGVVLVDLEL